MAIDEICKWKKADTKKTLARLGLDKLFEAEGIGPLAEDLFGEVPATFTKTGNVVHHGPVLCDAQGHGIYIIEGSLVVDGAFTFYTADAYTVLVVTGDLVAEHLVQAWDTQLVVLGQTKVKGLVYLDVSDAGFSVFRGTVTSKERLTDDNRHRWQGPSEPDEIHAALLRREPLFAAEATGKQKPPSKAELAKMTPLDVLTKVTSGFEDMQIQDNQINPNWFRKGKPGCALESVSLISETYLDEFPDTLATLRSLTLLNNKDGTRLVAMLRSLPKLRALRKLRLSGTGIDRLPAELGALEQLEELELAGNKALSALPPEIGKLSKLRSLVVTGNAIAKLPPELDLDRIANVIFEEPALELRRQRSSDE